MAMADLIGVKNTFLDILDPGFTNLADVDPQSWSCPAAAFGGDSLDSFSKLSGLAAAARAFSHGSLTREALEAAGHLGPRHITIGREKPCSLECLSTTDGVSSTENVHCGSSTQSCCEEGSSIDAVDDHQCQWPLSPLTSIDPESSPASPVNMLSSDSLSQPCNFEPQGVQISGLVVPKSWTMPPPPPSRPAPLAPAPLMPPADKLPPPPGVPPQTVPLTWYRVAFVGGIQLRTAPFVDAPRSNTILFQNETFSVSEEIRGTDGRVYLRVANGQGWAFDDTLLNPEDPSVKRGHWNAMQTAPVHSVLPTCSVSAPSWEPVVISQVEEQALPAQHKRRRRKRGGVRRNRSKRMATALAEADECSENDEEADIGSTATEESEDAVDKPTKPDCEEENLL